MRTILLILFICGISMADIFVTSHNSESNRYVIVEELNGVCYAYLTENDSQRPSSDILLYSTQILNSKDEVREQAEAGNPPQLYVEYQTSFSLRTDIAESDILISWYSSGESAVISIKNEPIAFLHTGKGYSKAISKEGFYGNPWNQNLYGELRENK